MKPTRHQEGFRRFALAIQYHGRNYLGVTTSSPPDKEESLMNGRSVTGILMDALHAFVGEGNYKNLQVSSRTDRGVHAFKNTLHVDLRERSSASYYYSSSTTTEDEDTATTTEPVQKEKKKKKKKKKVALHPVTIQNALNFYLCRPQIRRKGCHSISNPCEYSSATSNRNYGETDIRVLNVVPAPLQHTYYYNNYKAKGSSLPTNSSDATAPYYVDEWNARFTAIQRRYVYRILTGCKADGLNTIFPFEWDRAWFIPSSSSSGNNDSRRELDTSLMQEAANYLIGTHDFTSFRGRNCQRASPITTISELAIHEDKNYYYSAYLGCSSSTLREDPQQQQQQKTNNQVRLITISVVGTSFLYRQVRNIVGCLVYVGQGRVSPMEVQRMLYAKDRKAAPPTAPAHALFLVDVEHEGLKI